MSPNEATFYNELKQYAETKDLLVFAKVRLADLVWIPKSYKRFNFFFNKIKSKHIDFVLCSKDFEIECLIELDDETHNLPDRQSRDKFVNKVLQKTSHNFLRCNSSHTCYELFD